MSEGLLVLLLGLLGFGAGALGAFIGAGGGFILAPLLLLLFPSQPASLVTSMSLTAVAVNALSGSFIYGRARRIAYRSALLLGGVAVPGAILGSLLTRWMPRGVFDALFALILAGLALYLLLRPPHNPQEVQRASGRGRWVEVVVDRWDRRYTVSFNPWLGAGASFLVGLVGTTMGIGGGPFRVPIMVYLLNFPVPIATATSLLALAIYTGVGVLTHLLTGERAPLSLATLALLAGMVVGSQIGARLSVRAKGQLIVRVLAVVLLGVAARLFFSLG